MRELEKMINAKIYDPNDLELLTLRKKAHRISYTYNRIIDEEDPERTKLLKEMLGYSSDVYLQGPIYFDYGCFTKFGVGCYANFNFTVLDVCPVEIGDHVFFGPNVTLATPMHPFLPKERMMYQNDKGIMTDKEYGKPILIESDCWIASNVTICGGVTIGKGSIIGAGSVVTRDIPSGVIAAGNPCKVIRKITENDSIELKKELW